MKNEMLEAARLAREGRLAEAAALIQRTMASGPAAARTRTRFMDVLERMKARPGNATGPHAPNPSEAAPADHATPHPPFTPPDLTSLGGLPGILKPGMRGPSLRQIPAELIAPAAGQWTTGTYTGEAGTRAFKLYLPSAYQGQPLPLVVMLHGCTQSADDFAAGTRMNFLAEEKGFLVAYPEQTAAANNSRCWNWFQAADQQRDQGEPSLIAGITRQVIAGHRVDADRVYIAGLSAGGAMAAIMAVAYPDLYAAVGVHSGVAPGSAHDLPSALKVMQQGGQRAGHAAGPRVTPLILFQGDHDSTVHPRNADELIRQWTAAPDQPQVTVRQGQVTDGKAYTCAVYHDPSGQAVAERWTIHGIGHAWSGGSRHGSYTDPAGPDASRELARFFQEHSRRGAAAGQNGQPSI
jgi:poly(hydroxyalkanoate) depolymerase family esterase